MKSLVKLEKYFMKESPPVRSSYPSLDREGLAERIASYLGSTDVKNEMNEEIEATELEVYCILEAILMRLLVKGHGNTEIFEDLWRYSYRVAGRVIGSLSEYKEIHNKVEKDFSEKS